MSDIVFNPSVDAATAPVRHIGFTDLRDALGEGISDFLAKPSHVIFLALIYPVVGVVLVQAAVVNDLIPLLFPLVAGFAILGPVAAVATYEVSRRRERGADTSWADLRRLLRAPEARLIAEMAAILLVIFVAWVAAAAGIFQATLGPLSPPTLGAFTRTILTTPSGWTLIVVGNLVGLGFAALAFSIGVVSFPMIVDRGVGLRAAIATSLRCVAVNPLVLAAWGVFIAMALAVGMALLFVGLAVALPVLGHASWHLYRKLVP